MLKIIYRVTGDANNGDGRFFLNCLTEDFCRWFMVQYHPEGFTCNAPQTLDEHKSLQELVADLRWCGYEVELVTCFS